MPQPASSVIIRLMLAAFVSVQNQKVNGLPLLPVNLLILPELRRDWVGDIKYVGASVFCYKSQLSSVMRDPAECLCIMSDKRGEV